MVNQAISVLNRLGKHSDDLEKNPLLNDCMALQEDFNLFGKKNFKFKALKIQNDYIDLDYRKNSEQFFIEQVSKKKRYNRIGQNETRKARSISVHNKIYDSLHDAARQLNESRTNLVRKCRAEDNEHYFFVQSTNENISYKFHKASPCKIYNRTFTSLNEAAKKLNINRSTIKNRILSKNYPEYSYYEKN